MKTTIPTKTLLKIINPVKHGIFYMDSLIYVDLKELQKYVDEPRKYEVFEKTDDPISTFYKNVALYIINTEDKPAFLSIDLNQDKPIEDGLFEYIRSIYLKKEQLFIELPEDGDNLLFIQSKSLVPFVQEKKENIYQAPIEKATDIELNQLNSIFMETKNLDSLNDEISTNSFNDNGTFSWVPEDADIYSSEKYILSQFEDIIKNHKENSKNKAEISLEQKIMFLLDKANDSVLQSDSFIMGIMDSAHYRTRDMLFSRAVLKKLNINFSRQIFQDKIQSDINKKEFHLLHSLFQLHLKSDENKVFKNYLNDMTFSHFINQPNVISDLIGQYTSKYDNNSEKVYSIVSTYHLLNEKNKYDSAVLSKYVDCIRSTNMNGDVFIPSYKLFDLPLGVFNRPEFLKSILAQLDIAELARELKKQNVTNELLTNKEFVVSNISSLDFYKIRTILNKFYNIEDIDKEFILKIIKSKPNFFTWLQSTDSDSFQLSKKTKTMLKDFDFIFEIYQNGVPLKDFKVEDFKQHLLSTDNDSYKEKLKIKYLIEKEIIDSSGENLFINPEDIQSFNAKYSKPEYLYLSMRGSFYSNKNRDKALSKIKTKTEIIDILNKMIDIKDSYHFNSRSFYNSLHSTLQKDAEIAQTLNEYGVLRYSDLTENLQFNKKIIIKFIQKEPAIIKLIPNEFFNDSQFSLSFARLLDFNRYDPKFNMNVPSFISKFFENQQVAENFEDYLKLYISMSSLKTQLNKTEVQVETKRKKI